MDWETFINRARQELQKAETFSEILAIRNAAAEISFPSVWIVGRALRNAIAEIRLRAERRLGKMLMEAAEQGHRKTAGRPRNGDTDETLTQILSHEQFEGNGDIQKTFLDVTISTIPPSENGFPEKKFQGNHFLLSLSEIGISKKQSSRWQLIAAIPEELFEQTIRELKQDRISFSQKATLTQKAMLKVARQIRCEQSDESRSHTVDRKSASGRRRLKQIGRAHV